MIRTYYYSLCCFFCFYFFLLRQMEISLETKRINQKKQKEKDESGINVEFNYKLITPDADYLQNFLWLGRHSLHTGLPSVSLNGTSVSIPQVRTGHFCHFSWSAATTETSKISPGVSVIKSRFPFTFALVDNC